MNDSHDHWEQVYQQRDPQTVSWFEPAPAISLALINALKLASDASILDVGGGASSLAASLLRDGYTDVTVADISRSALLWASAQLGDDARRVGWVNADVRSHEFDRCYDLWHDRAVFHFMVRPADRQGYLEVLRRTLSPGGHVILATFGPDGPTRCSGLPVNRYSSAELLRQIGSDFEPISSQLHKHETPAGAAQQFLYLLAHRRVEQ